MTWKKEYSTLVVLSMIGGRGNYSGQWITSFSGSLCSVDHFVQWVIPFSGSLCSVEQFVQWK